MNYWRNVSQYFYQTSSSPAIQYHGLLNQGATCYLNSVLQVLFMTEDFREAVKQHKQENPDTECIDCHLTPLFDDLEKHEAYTFKITNTLGIKRVYEQQDAAECFEKILGLTSPEASKIFRGQLTRTTECSTCLHGPKSDGAFWHLPLELVESYSEDYNVVNGIEEFFRDSDLSGENQMYCDECDDKSDAKIKCAIKDHPEVLMLLLKRFEFDYQYMAYVKINCTVAVPYTLQIPGNQTYELYAVVHHSGDLRSGHYTATIRSQDDDQWYNFNDSKVSLCGYQLFQVDSFEKSSSAYLLFYRKKKVHAADTCPQDITEVSAPGGFSPADIEKYYPCQDDIDMRETENVEVVEDVSNKPAVAVSIDTNEEAGINVNTPGVRGATPSAVPYSISVEGQGVNVRQRLSYNQQECDEERKDVRYHPQDAHAEKQRYDRKVVTDDEEDIRGNAESEDEAEKRGTSLRGTQLEESVDYRDNDSAGVDNVRHQESLEVADIHDPSYQSCKQEFSYMHVRCDDLQQVCVDMQRDEDRVVVDINRDKDREMEGNEQSERREKSSVEHHEDKEFDVRKDMHGDLDSKQEIGQHYTLIPLSVDKQEPDVKVDEEDETGADEREVASGSVKPFTKYDLCSFQDSRRVSDSRQNRPKDDHWCQQGKSSRHTRHDQPRQDKRDVKEVKEQRTEDAKHANRKEISMTNPNLSRVVEDQDKRRLDSVRQNMNEGLESKQKIGQQHTRQPLNVDKQGNWLEVEPDVKVDKEDETGADEREVASGSVKPFTKYDLCSFQDSRRVSDSRQNRPKDDHWCQQGKSSRHTRHDQPRQDKRADERKVASGSAKALTKYDLMEQKTGDDKYAKREETSMTNPNLTKGVEGQDTRRSDNVRQDRPQQKVSVKHSSRKNSVDKQANNPTQRRTDSFPRQAELTDSRKVAENREVEGAEKMCKSQPKARTGYNDNAVEGRHGSRIYAKRIDSEVRETRSIIKGSSETDLTVKTTEETVRQDTVLVGVRSLNLSESPSQEPQQRGTKRVMNEENETQDTIQAIPKKQKKLATEKTGEHEKGRTRRWLPRLFARQKSNRKEKKKWKKPTLCRIPCINPTPESD